ncbi:Broad specificity phosphatase PhoE [Deinococcus reticulitermitis]|uniref:Broad specificity phosphatase PhoE n=1 Tax=Deinococcus reticulitermitis TaxID=856736 RepID=A0A1H6ZI25_9DEIO|nr:histidine phosphatase family protein [Deinococcus reticulitermitis]SEJ53079.1 Broad specificity phosphatase PhoE [Deinococcus reticulitermitis]
MSELILIRHGQATPFEQDTDRLSPLGERQAQAVGRFLVEEGVRPTHVLHGALTRQRRTAGLAAEAAGGGWPEPTLDPRLDEYDGDGLIRTLAPLLARQDATFAGQVRAFEAQRGERGPERNRAFQLLLETLADAWQAGTVIHPEVEGWTAYRARVAAAARDLLALPSGSTVLAFTSGGVIGLLVALALGAPDAAALRLNWRVRNASLTRLTFGGGRVSLDSFNEQGHLGREERSWR